MNANFPACLTIILASEGGYVVDQGGATNLGVTQGTLSTWLRRPATVEDVKALTRASVGPLYQTLYWGAAHCDAIPTGLDLMVFDEAVNEGPGQAVRHLQEALGVQADGVFGPHTALALRGLSGASGIAAVLQRLHDDNGAFYRALAGRYPQDAHGWQARNDRTLGAALQMAAH